MRLGNGPPVLLGLTLVERLAPAFDAAALSAEFAVVRQRYQPSTQVGPRHNGKWNRLGPFSPSGDPTRSMAQPGESKARTEVLDLMPTAVGA